MKMAGTALPDFNSSAAGGLRGAAHPFAFPRTVFAAEHAVVCIRTREAVCGNYPGKRMRFAGARANAKHPCARTEFP